MAYRLMVVSCFLSLRFFRKQSSYRTRNAAQSLSIGNHCSSGNRNHSSSSSSFFPPLPVRPPQIPEPSEPTPLPRSFVSITHLALGGLGYSPTPPTVEPRPPTRSPLPSLPTPSPTPPVTLETVSPAPLVTPLTAEPTLPPLPGRAPVTLLPRPSTAPPAPLPDHLRLVHVTAEY